MADTAPSPAASASAGGKTALAGEILLVAALSLVLRAWNLLLLPIFTDESTYLRWAADIYEQKTRAALLIPILEDGKQPLFMWLAGAATILTPDPLLAGRAVSVAAGVASTLGIYFAGRWLSGSRMGLVAALLYAVGPLNLFFDRMALVEGLLTACGIWAFAWGSYLALRVGDRQDAARAGIALGAALGIGVWTKATAAFMISFPILCVLFLAQRRDAGKLLAGLGAALLTFGLFLGAMATVPDPWRMVEKAQSFSMSLSDVMRLPLGVWRDNGLAYWSWFQTYLPIPLWPMVLAAAAWGLVTRRRVPLLLLACWAAFALPPIINGLRQAYTTRYVVPGVFPLLLLAADFMVLAWAGIQGWLSRRPSPGWAAPAQKGPMALALLLVILAPSLKFDARIIAAPETAELAYTDRYHYVAGWPAGYGFMEAMEMVKQRAREITGAGQPVIVLTDFPQGLPYDGVRLYMRNMPGVFHYVDGHLARDAEGFAAAWRSHGVPILIIGNEGRADLDAFEAGVPQAKRIGFFPKPTNRSSYRVYEVDPADLNP